MTKYFIDGITYLKNIPNKPTQLAPNFTIDKLFRGEFARWELYVQGGP